MYSPTAFLGVQRGKYSSYNGPAIRGLSQKVVAVRMLREPGPYSPTVCPSKLLAPIPRPSTNSPGPWIRPWKQRFVKRFRAESDNYQIRLYVQERQGQWDFNTDRDGFYVIAVGQCSLPCPCGIGEHLERNHCFPCAQLMLRRMYILN